MQTKNTRSAYICRMLSRLEGEEIRLQELIFAGELNDEGAALARKLLTESRKNLATELSDLETDN